MPQRPKDTTRPAHRAVTRSIVKPALGASLFAGAAISLIAVSSGVAACTQTPPPPGTSVYVPPPGTMPVTADASPLADMGDATAPSTGADDASLAIATNPDAGAPDASAATPPPPGIVPAPHPHAHPGMVPRPGTTVTPGLAPAGTRVAASAPRRPTRPTRRATDGDVRVRHAAFVGGGRALA